MQRYEGFSGVDDDCGVSVFIVPDCSRFVSERGSLRSPQPVENGLYFTWREGFSAFVVAHFLQLVPEHVVVAYHGHQVLDGRLRRAVGEVLQGEFFFAKCSCFCFHGLRFRVRVGLGPVLDLSRTCLGEVKGER